MMLSPDSSILVADDVAAVVSTVTSMLTVLGFDHVLAARDGHEALALLDTREPPGLIICDWSMPRFSGIDVLKRVRSTPEWAALPLLMLTTRLEPADRSLLEDLEASGWLAKPISFEHLQAAIAALRSPQGMIALHRALARVRHHVAQDDLSRAEEELRSAARELPAFKPRLQVEMAGLWLMTSRADQARALLSTLLDDHPGMSRALWVLAQAHEVLEEYEQAMAAIELALQINPQHAEYQFLAGKMHLFLGQPGKAKQAFHRALNTDPHNSELKERVWNVYLEQSLIDRVEQDFGPFLFNHLGVETLNSQGMALRKQNRLDEAIVLYQRALKLHPQSDRLLYNLAVALVNQNKVAKAKVRLEQALAVNPNFAQALNLLNKLVFLQEVER